MSDSGASDGEFEYTPPPAPLPDGVQKEILEKGDQKNWRKPKEGDDLTVHYVGTLQSDSSQFDSSRDRGEPVTFTLGKGQVIKGWDLGIATMTKGEKARLTIQPEFAYGEQGQPPTIPPNAVLIFEVELISWVAKDDLFGDNGVVKAIVQEGVETWKNPPKNSEVCISLQATAQNGTVIEDRPELDYVIGSGDLGPLSRIVDKTLLNMSKNEKCSLACAKDYVYKDSGHGKVTVELELKQMYNTNDVSMLSDGTVMKKSVVEGEDHATPEDSFAVTLRVVSATDGTQPLPGFTGPKELKFKCCHGDVCDALEGAARDMKKGERAIVTCTVPWKAREAQLGLAEVDVPKIVFTLEMIDFTKGKEMWNRSDEDKVELALFRKDVGAQLFKARRFELALDKYKKVIETIGSHDNFHEDLKKGCAELKRTIELNKAACYLQLGDPTNALASCNKVLREDRNNVKALFRRAKAHHGRTEHVEAEADLNRVLELEPGNTEARAMIPQVRRAQKIADKASKNTFAKMCEGFGKIGSGREAKKEEPKPVEPEPPQEKPDKVQVTFKIEYKPQDGEIVHVIGEPELLGEWDASRTVAMTKLPQKWEPPVGSGRAPPEHHHWEVTVELPEELGRFEYQYLIRGPSGDRQEQGSKHKCDLTGMGGSRMRCTDSWRGEFA